MGRNGVGRSADDEQGGDPAALAKNICLRLLTARPRTRVELRQALLRKGVEEDIADRVLHRLDDAGLLDDTAFAEMWVRSRHDIAGLGRRAVVAELRRKGVDESVAADAASAIDADAEEKRARQLVRKKLPASVGADELTRVRRLVAALARKGYPQGLAYRVVREEVAAAGHSSECLADLTPE